MTRKLYFEDSHLTETEALVLSCEALETDFGVTLDQTLLFPNGGGQPCDLGRIGAANVLSVDEVEGKIVHLVDRPLPAGERMPVALDWARRFDLMQQHTGEHLLSFVCFDRFGAANVGFHLALDHATIDLDKPLTAEQLDEAAAETNRLIHKNLPVRCDFYESEEEILHLPLRKHAEGLTAPIRIVSIPGADSCTCCAPHCKYTGEVGSLLLADFNPYKGGVRVFFHCGMRAVRQAAFDHEALSALARRFSTGREQVLSAVKKQGEALNLARREERRLSEALGAYIAKELLDAAPIVKGTVVAVAALEEMSPARLSALAARLTEREGTLCVLFGEHPDQLSYVLACSGDVQLDMGELCQAVNAITGGKGGGRGTRAQGMAKGFSGAAGDTVAQIRDYLEKRLAAAPAKNSRFSPG